MILARTFGRVDVDQFLAELEPATFDGWIASYLVDPWGPERFDAAIGRLAILVDRLTSAMTGSNDDRITWPEVYPRPGPFDPEYDDDDQDFPNIQSTAEQIEILKSMFPGGR